ncbi:hypothetical protein [Aneurinibacillus tyrosinisolvens]|uniref:hypothetical protein n=1 Tax=Aneurinibacillus tyrosinisolvens TaxID=1443435 RepID=UPI00069CB66D|nr:hypothetical protein [Aneurinibacillus tyrosinisolvens]
MEGQNEQVEGQEQQEQQNDSVEESQGNENEEVVSKVGEEEKSLQDAQKALEEREAVVFNKEVEIALKEAGLSDFAEIINVKDAEELKATIGKINKIINARKINQSFKPDGNNKQVDKYAQAEKQGDVVGMIGHKLSGLFK